MSTSARRGRYRSYGADEVGRLGILTAVFQTA
jgi:hypothetical protein